MDNRETSTPSSDDPILKRHLFSGVTIKGRGDVGRVYFVRRPSRQSFGFRVAASSGPILKAPGAAGGFLRYVARWRRYDSSSIGWGFRVSASAVSQVLC